MTDCESALATHPFTREVRPAFLQLLNGCATSVRFNLDEQIFQEGLEADRFYLIHRGRVALQTFVPGTGLVTLQTIGEGEALGWSWLYPPYRWHFSALTVEPVETVAFCGRSLRDLMRENPEFGCEIAMRVGDVLLERLQATRLRLLQMYGAPD